MACMYGRCRRVVGVGVRCVWRWRMVCYGVCMALGRRMVALGMRIYGVGCTVCRRWVYVWCTLCMCRVVYVVCVRCVYRSMT